MKTLYAAISAKTADDAVKALRELETAQLGVSADEIEIRQVIPFGQRALVIYVVYEKGVVR